jgi:hypothetical protein
MTQNEIIEMAIQAEINLYVHDLTEKRYIEVIEAFAKLVAEKEREECALLCEEERINAVHYSAPTQSNWLAKKIRAK